MDLVEIDAVVAKPLPHDAKALTEELAAVLEGRSVLRLLASATDSRRKLGGELPHAGGGVIERTLGNIEPFTNGGAKRRRDRISAGGQQIAADRPHAAGDEPDPRLAVLEDIIRETRNEDAARRAPLGNRPDGRRRTEITILGLAVGVEVLPEGDADHDGVLSRKPAREDIGVAAGRANEVVVVPTAQGAAHDLTGQEFAAELPESEDAGDERAVPALGKPADADDAANRGAGGSRPTHAGENLLDLFAALRFPHAEPAIGEDRALGAAGVAAARGIDDDGARRRLRAFQTGGASVRDIRQQVEPDRRVIALAVGVARGAADDLVQLLCVAAVVDDGDHHGMRAALPRRGRVVPLPLPELAFVVLVQEACRLGDALGDLRVVVEVAVGRLVEGLEVVVLDTVGSAGPTGNGDQTRLHRLVERELAHDPGKERLALGELLPWRMVRVPRIDEERRRRHVDGLRHREAGMPIERMDGFHPEARASRPSLGGVAALPAVVTLVVDHHNAFGPAVGA